MQDNMAMHCNMKIRILSWAINNMEMTIEDKMDL